MRGLKNDAEYTKHHFVHWLHFDERRQHVDHKGVAARCPNSMGYQSDALEYTTSLGGFWHASLWRKFCDMDRNSCAQRVDRCLSIGDRTDVGGLNIGRNRSVG